MFEFAVPDDLLSDDCMAKLGDACEAYLLDEGGQFDPKRLDVRRKRFCEFLGIGESTFTGWTQAGRIPRAAAIAFVLHRNLLDRSRRIRQLEQDRLEPRVVLVDGRFALCEFLENEDGEIEGRLVATGIPDREIAQDLARRRSGSFANLLSEAAVLLSDLHDNHPELLGRLEDVANALEDYRDPTRKRERRKALQKLIDEPTDEGAGAGGQP
jgi:hypothetical protein